MANLRSNGRGDIIKQGREVAKAMIEEIDDWAHGRHSIKVVAFVDGEEYTIIETQRGTENIIVDEERLTILNRLVGFEYLEDAEDADG